MFIIKKYIKKPLNVKDIYFAEKPLLKYGLLVNYFQSKAVNRNIFFQRKNFYTKKNIIGHDLYESVFSKSCLYKINRAIRENISCRQFVDINQFLILHNQFKINKGIGGILKVEDVKLSEVLVVRP